MNTTKVATPIFTSAAKKRFGIKFGEKIGTAPG
jgi:hypothetical protein